jgi:hypothetical protein
MPKKVVTIEAAWRVPGERDPDGIRWHVYEFRGGKRFLDSYWTKEEALSAFPYADITLTEADLF